MELKLSRTPKRSYIGNRILFKILIILFLFSFTIQSAHANIIDQGPPLSEKEARQIILEEAQKAGVALTFITRSTEDEIHYDNFSFLGFFDHLALDQSEIAHPFSRYKDNTIFYLAKKWSSPLDVELYPSWRRQRQPQSFFIDAFNLRLHIACVYLAEDEFEYIYPFLNSPDAVSDTLIKELEDRNTPFFYGIFTSCDEDTLRFQCRCFFAWWNYQMKLRLID